MTRRLLVAALVLGPVLAIVLGIMAMGAALFAPQPVTPVSVSVPSAVRVVHLQSRLQEDDPGWDCRVRGNRVCGPGAAP